jgi:hypothetical protein
MLVLICVQIVQTNNNESNWKKRQQHFIVDKHKLYKLAKKAKQFN